MKVHQKSLLWICLIEALYCLAVACIGYLTSPNTIEIKLFNKNKYFESYLIPFIPIFALAFVATSPWVIQHVRFLRTVFWNLKNSSLKDLVLKSSPLQLFLLSLSAGVFEEFAFRGILLPAWGIW